MTGFLTTFFFLLLLLLFELTPEWHLWTMVDLFESSFKSPTVNGIFFFEFLETLLFLTVTFLFAESVLANEELRVRVRFFASTDFFLRDNLLPESLKALSDGTTVHMFLSF